MWGCYHLPSAPCAGERESAGRGGGEGRAVRGSFPPFSFIPRGMEIGVAALKRFPPGARRPGWLCARSHPSCRFPLPGPGADPLPRIPCRPPQPRGGRPAGVISLAQGGAARRDLRVIAGRGRPLGPPRPRRPASQVPHPAPTATTKAARVAEPANRAGAEQLGEHEPSPRRGRRRRRLPSPLSRKDSLRFCASALFLWRGRSRDSSRARASAPCISPCAAGGGARGGRGRPASTDVSLKEPP